MVVSDIVTMVESRYYINGRVKYKRSGSVRMSYLGICQIINAKEVLGYYISLSVSAETDEFREDICW